jgi:dTDP-4-dehydrorhamnose 3,5-epimerase-like enzyme
MNQFNFLKEIESKSFSDSRGVLEFIELPDENSFCVKRLYYISEVPTGSIRGAHAHKQLQQFFFAISGSFLLTVTDGIQTESVRVLANSHGYFMPNGYWRELSEFEPNTICLVLASEHFEESDYIQEKSSYLEWKNLNGN